jgi:beta-lactamase regulating signal transducer with metallopeptidase domain
MKRNLSAALTLILALAVVLPAILSAQATPQTNEVQAATQAAPAKPAAKPKAPAEPVTIYPVYSSLKEKTAVLVFLAWLWVVVGILVWLLRMKIREADRVHGLKFYPAAKDGSRPPTP